MSSWLGVVPVVRSIYAERRAYLARFGPKFVGVHRMSDGLGGPERRYFQIRISAAEAVAVTSAGIAYRSWTRAGLWRRVAIAGCGMVEAGDSEIKAYLPQTVAAGADRRLAIPVVTGTGSQGDLRAETRGLRCWFTVGNRYTVSCEPFTLAGLAKG